VAEWQREKRWQAWQQYGSMAVGTRAQGKCRKVFSGYIRQGEGSETVRAHNLEQQGYSGTKGHRSMVRNGRHYIHGPHRLYRHGALEVTTARNEIGMAPGRQQRHAALKADEGVVAASR